MDHRAIATPATALRRRRTLMPLRSGGWPLLALSFAIGCTSPLELGERRYREGDPLAAMEIWRGVDEGGFGYEQTQVRLREVATEYEQLVIRHKQRGRYFEDKGRLAESVLSYRLALKLKPGDRETLDHVQGLVRTLAKKRHAAQELFHEHFEAGDLAGARQAVEQLQILDPFSPGVAEEEHRLRQAFRSEVERLLARGRRGFTSGNHRSAALAFREVLELDAENESARGYLSYIAKIRSEEAAGDPVRIGPSDPREIDASDAEIRAEGFFQNALAAERAGDPYTAIRFDLRALRANPKHPRVRAHLGELRRQRRPEVEALIEAGRRHYQEEDLQTALDQWRRALLIDPGNAQAKEYTERAEGLLENLDRLRGQRGGNRR